MTHKVWLVSLIYTNIYSIKEKEKQVCKSFLRVSSFWTYSFEQRSRKDAIDAPWHFRLSFRMSIGARPDARSFRMNNETVIIYVRWTGSKWSGNFFLSREPTARRGAKWIHFTKLKVKSHSRAKLEIDALGLKRWIVTIHTKCLVLFISTITLGLVADNWRQPREMPR